DLSQSADAATCAAFAAGRNGGHTFTIPSGVSTATVGGNPLALEAVIDSSRGPGTYATPAFGDPTATTLTVDQASALAPFEPVDAGASESATIAADGSGAFTFNDWEDPALRIESGSVSWRCV